MSRCGTPQSPFFRVLTFLRAKGEQKLHDSKLCQNRLSSYTNIFISNRRKLGSKKRAPWCPASRHALSNKKKFYIQLAWNERNSPEDQKIRNREKAKNLLSFRVRARSQPRKLQTNRNLEDMLRI